MLDAFPEDFDLGHFLLDAAVGTACLPALVVAAAAELTPIVTVERTGCEVLTEARATIARKRAGKIAEEV